MTAPAGYVDPNWSPDGTKILLGRPVDPTAEILAVDLRTGKAAPIPGSKGLYSTRWSPDGRSIVALSAENARLVLFALATEQWRDLATSGAGFDYPNWTRDGRHLVYSSGGRMFTYELGSGEIKRMDTGFAIDCNNDHVLSPDNTQIPVSHFTNEDATSRIYILPFAGGSPVLVTDKGPS